MSTKPNKIAEIRKRKRLTQQQLADRLGVHTITVSKLERGVMQLTSTWLERLAKALDVAEHDLWEGFTLREIEASGRIFADGQVRIVNPERNRFFSGNTPLGETAAKWLHVRDNALLPFFGAGDLLEFSAILIEELDGASVFNGRLCMYAVDGDERPSIGVMESRNDDFTYNLRTLNGRQIRSVRVGAIMYLTGYKPNWGVVSIQADDAEKDEELADTA